MKNLATYFWIGILVLILSIILNISLGSVSIPLDEVLKSIFHLDVSKESWQIIVVDYRLPKAFTAILVGSGLALSGLLMQTLFRNPLAGPYVLGLSSGASLGVALVLMGSSLFGGVAAGLFLSKWTLVIASSLGSFLVL
ncbi:MAG: iron chelate uptake ABC transporter family permease subunit, partial [Mesonia sp.]